MDDQSQCTPHADSHLWRTAFYDRHSCFHTTKLDEIGAACLHPIPELQCIDSIAGVDNTKKLGALFIDSPRSRDARNRTLEGTPFDIGVPFANIGTVCVALLFPLLASDLSVQKAMLVYFRRSTLTGRRIFQER